MLKKEEEKVEGEKGKNGKRNQPISKQISRQGELQGVSKDCYYSGKTFFFFLASNTVTNQNL